MRREKKPNFDVEYSSHCFGSFWFWCGFTSARQRTSSHSQYVVVAVKARRRVIVGENEIAISPASAYASFSFPLAIVNLSSIAAKYYNLCILNESIVASLSLVSYRSGIHASSGMQLSRWNIVKSQMEGDSSELWKSWSCALVPSMDSSRKRQTVYFHWRRLLFIAIPSMKHMLARFFNANFSLICS